MAERPGDMDERDVDARFASIVAGWDAPPADARDDSPELAEAPDAEGSDDAAAPPEPAPPPSPWVTPAPLDVVVPASAWRTAESPDAAAEGVEAAEADPGDDHFEPPEVVLPPQEDLHFWGAVTGLVAGPLMLLYVVFARPFHSTRWFVAAVVVSLVGFTLLVLRQPAHRDPTSGDDGARV